MNYNCNLSKLQVLYYNQSAKVILLNIKVCYILQFYTCKQSDDGVNFKSLLTKSEEAVHVDNVKIVS